MKELFLRYYSNILLRNSLYPMLATAVAALFGFLFWIFSARLFSVEEVGLAATLVSTVGILGIFSLIGYDSSTVRFLAHEKNKSVAISTGFASIGIFSIILSGAFLLMIPFISPLLLFITEHISIALIFVFFTTMTALNVYTEAVFLAYRHTVYTFIVTVVFSAVKIFLPFAFVDFGAIGIFCAASLSQVLGLVLSVMILMQRFSYRPSLTFDMSVIARFGKFSAGSYLADIFNFLPLALLPILITNTLGAEQAAYYYVVIMIAGFLYVIPASTMRALFAEGSYNEASIPKNSKQSLTTTALLLTPLILLLLFTDKYILVLFGTNYATSGTSLLKIAVLNSILVTVSALYGSLFRLSNTITALVLRSVAYAGGTLLLAYLFLYQGLEGIGVALIGGNVLAIVVSHFAYLYIVPHDKKKNPFTFKKLPERILARLNEYYLWPIQTFLIGKLDYYRAQKRPSYEPKIILFYPEAPKTFHTLYKICHYLGWKISTNPKKPSDVRIFFEDTTYRNEYPILTELHTTHHVINIACTDISKKHVDEVFGEVFGYCMSLDPRTHQGACVQKSNINALHDGKVVQCPTEPKEGYVYQKLINTLNENNKATDLRIHIFNNSIPVVLERYKEIDDIFNRTVGASFLETDDALTKEEQEKIVLFCKKMGLEYGELDALRSKDDGLLYIVDVNNTPSGPIGPLYDNSADILRWFLEIAKATKKEFSSTKKD